MIYFLLLESFFHSYNYYYLSCLCYLCCHSCDWIELTFLLEESSLYEYWTFHSLVLILDDHVSNLNAFSVVEEEGEAVVAMILDLPVVIEMHTIDDEVVEAMDQNGVIDVIDDELHHYYPYDER